MESKGIIRLRKEGPVDVGLSEMTLHQDDFQSPLPTQCLHVYFEDPEQGLTVGVWTTTSMQEAFGPYPGDEFMCILEGQVAMVDDAGNETTVNEGETFCVRNAIPVSWKQVGFLRKFFITFNRPDGVVPSITSVKDGIHVLRQDELASKLQTLPSPFPFEFDGPAPAQRDASVFANDTQNVFVGMWESDPFESRMKPFPCSEFVQLLEGKISITVQSGETHHFSAGDVFFIPNGTVCSWKSSGSVRKFYCMISAPEAQ